LSLFADCPAVVLVIDAIPNAVIAEVAKDVSAIRDELAPVHSKSSASASIHSITSSVREFPTLHSVHQMDRHKVSHPTLPVDGTGPMVRCPLLARTGSRCITIQSATLEGNMSDALKTD
jgi:hypothetical protein